MKDPGIMLVILALAASVLAGGIFFLWPDYEMEVVIENDPLPGEEIFIESESADSSVTVTVQEPAMEPFVLEPCQKNAEPVTWQGTLFDASGSAIPFAEVRTIGAGPPYPGRHRRNIKADKWGRFIQEGLIPGSYWVDLVISGQYLGNVGKFTFQTAGVVERDIHLDGGAIRGVVIDEETGKPLKTESKSRAPMVRAREVRGRSKEVCAFLREGCFSLNGILPGTYDLTVSGQGLIETTVPGMEITEGRIIDNARIMIPKRGQLRLYFNGSCRPLIEKLEVTLHREGDKEPYCRKIAAEEKSRRSTMQWGLPPGRWAVQVSSMRLGSVERWCEIRSGELIEIEIRMDHFRQRESDIVLEGHLFYADGRCPGEVSLQFQSEWKEKGFPGLVSALRGGTGQNGAFSVQGFQPGFWKVSALDFKHKINIHGFAEILIPEGHSGPLYRDLILSSGIIRGTLLDASRGLPFAEDGPRWEFRLTHIVTGEVVIETERHKTGPRLELPGLNGGEYRLRVQAVSYEDYESGPLTLGGCNELNVGAIRLKPAGIFSINVMDPEGETIGPPRITFMGLEKAKHPRLIPSGKGWYIPIPAPVTAFVQVTGYEQEELTFVVPSGEIREFNVVLDPKWLGGSSGT